MLNIKDLIHLQTDRSTGTAAFGYLTAGDGIDTCFQDGYFNNAGELLHKGDSILVSSARITRCWGLHLEVLGIQDGIVRTRIRPCRHVTGEEIEPEDLYDDE